MDTRKWPSMAAVTDVRGKVGVRLELHPYDNDAATAAAAAMGIQFEDFCLLAIHLHATEIGKQFQHEKWQRVGDVLVRNRNTRQETSARYI